MQTLKEKIEFVNCCDTTVDDRPRSRITVAVRMLRIRRVEPSVVPFSADNDGKLGHVGILGIAKLLE